MFLYIHSFQLALEGIFMFLLGLFASYLQIGLFHVYIVSSLFDFLIITRK